MILSANTPIYTFSNGKVRNSKHIQAVETVEHLFQLKRQSGSDPFPVIEACLNVWAEQNPKAYKSFLVDVTDRKDTRRDKYGRSETGSFRYTLDVPQQVMYMIRMIYSAEELVMDKEFFRAWAQRFPKLKIAEKN